MLIGASAYPDGGELVEDGAGGEQAGGERGKPCPQGDVQAVSQEGDEHTASTCRFSGSYRARL